MEFDLDLLTKESRKQWEQKLCVLYVQPILNDMEPRLAAAQNLFINDDRQGIPINPCMCAYCVFLFLN